MTSPVDPSPASAGVFRSSFRRGLVEVLPLALGIIPFGLVAGATAVDAGLGVEGAVSLSMLVFAGASQLAAIELMRTDAPLLVVVVTVAVINLRMAMYSAALAPVLARSSIGRRLGAAYVLTDQAFAMTVARDTQDPTGWDRLGYYLGIAVPLWLFWQVDTVVGALIGAAIPEWLPLSAAIPLVFLALLVPALTDRATLAAAVVSGALATLGAGLPFNAGLLLGAFAGIAVGTVVALRAAPHGDLADGPHHVEDAAASAAVDARPGGDVGRPEGGAR